MIRRLLASNYRSLGEGVEILFGRLTALVGPNGSGKSNVADALRFVSNCLRIGLEQSLTKRHGINAVRRFSEGHPFDLAIHVDVEGDDKRSGFYEFVLAGDRAEEYRVKREVAEFGGALDRTRFEIVEGQWRSGPPELRPKVDRLSLALPLVAADERLAPLANALRDVAVYSVFPETLREPQKPDPARPMTEHGGNWASVLKGLLKTPAAAQLKAALGQVTGDIDDARIEQVGGYLVTQFRHSQAKANGSRRHRSKWFDAVQESDGTLRVAGILTALLQDPPLTLVGVEEPELTIHPGAIPLLYDFLREAADRSQVLLTTHSPDLLSLLDASDVRVVTRTAGVTDVARMEASQREAVESRLLTLGDVLRMEGIRPADEDDPQASDER